jgi:hypothetical protein
MKVAFINQPIDTILPPGQTNEGSHHLPALVRGMPNGRCLVDLTPVPNRNSRVGLTAGLLKAQMEVLIPCLPSIHVPEVYRFEPPHLWVTAAPQNMVYRSYKGNE